MTTPKKDQSTVTPDGERKLTLIEGVVTRQPITHVDERGTVVEIWNDEWDLVDFPLVYVYQVTIVPGKIKGWQQHHIQHDRIFVSRGRVRIVLYDPRPDSPTFGMINEFNIGESNRLQVVIPPYVWHAIQNIGTDEAMFVNTPSRAYNHEDPDKYRLPINDEAIPYRFDENPLGW